VTAQAPLPWLVTGVMRHLVRGEVAAAVGLLTEPNDRIQDFCDLLRRTRLAGYFFCLVHASAAARCFPDASLLALEEAYREQVRRNDDNLRLMCAIRQQLGDASIPFLTIKGLYLAQRFFGDIHRRFMWDIDILVHSADLDGALAALAAIGYRGPPGIDVDSRRPFWGIHAVEVSGPGGKIDVHHVLRNLPGIHFDYARMWSEASEFSVGDEHFATLNATDTLLTAALGLGTDLQNGHHNLRKIWDIFIMLRALDDSTCWNTFFLAREREGSLKLLLNVFAFCLLVSGASLGSADRSTTQPDCPRLVSALAMRRSLLLIPDRETAWKIFARPRQHPANRLLFSRLLPVSPLRYWLRWLATLAVRVWHYRRVDRRPPTRGARSG